MEYPAHIRSRLWALGVRASEIEEKFVRGSGPGGQKINKTSSTVCLRHRPTGIEVRCQAERSQAANRERAWRVLADKLASRAQAMKDAAQQEREQGRRRTRQKNRAQKVRMIHAKKLRAKSKAQRMRIGDDT